MKLLKNGMNGIGTDRVALRSSLVFAVLAFAATSSRANDPSHTFLEADLPVCYLDANGPGLLARDLSPFDEDAFSLSESMVNGGLLASLSRVASAGFSAPDSTPEPIEVEPAVRPAPEMGFAVVPVSAAPSIPASAMPLVFAAVQIDPPQQSGVAVFRNPSLPLADNGIDLFRPPRHS